MKNKGFTLIELLAVIVILAIIALIATPIVLNIIEDSKKSAVLIGAEFYADAIEYSLLNNQMKNSEVEDGEYDILSNGNICIEGSASSCTKELQVDVSGETPNSGTIRIEEGKLENGFLKYDDNVITKVDDKFIIVSKPQSFETDDWITIIANVKLGNIDKYEVGAEKEITLTSTDDDSGNADGFTTGTYTVRIANLPSEAEKTEGCGTEGFSETACGFVIEFVDIITTRQMNSGRTNVGGWPASELYEFVTEDIYNAIPNEIRSNIIYTKVVSGAESIDKSNYVTIDKLYLLAPREVYKNDMLFEKDLLTNTRLLDYYTIQININSNYKAEKVGIDGEDTGWWLRSTDFTDTINFFGIPIGSGYLATFTSGSELGVSPAFRLG